MWRDIDSESRPHDIDRPEGARGGRPEPSPVAPLSADPRDVFTRDLDLPRGRDRERVHLQERTYQLRGSETRILATVGAFRTVPEADVRSGTGARSRDVRHLRDVGLIEARAYVVGKTRTAVLTLTDRGREVLERSRREGAERPGQTFHSGISKPRELAHDSYLYRAYTRAAERLVSDGGSVRRVILEEELKREYQRFLQAPNRRRRDSDGRPNRTEAEIAEWARALQLPMDDGHVQFPDLRIEYEERDGRRLIEDVEITTPHYRGAHAAAKARAGFTSYRASGARVGGSGGRSRGGGRGFNPRVAEEVLE